MKNIVKIAQFVAVLAIFAAVASAISFADTTQYKQSFNAQMTGAGEIIPTSSSMTGTAQFNVSMDETSIDYTTSTTGDSSSIVLECLVNNQDVYQIATLSTSGTIVESSLIADAQACNPNIHTVAHLVQAMREGSVYVNVLTSAFPTGEIRGKVVDGVIVVVTPSPTPTPTPSPSPTPVGTPEPTPTPTPTPTTGGNSSGSGSVATGRGTIVNPAPYFGQTVTTSTTTCPYLTSYIGSHIKNDVTQVAYLQIFLNKEMKAGLKINGTYDANTIASVNAFQTKYADDVLKPWVSIGYLSSTTPTGFVYKTTSWKINSIACGVSLPQPKLP